MNITSEAELTKECGSTNAHNRKNRKRAKSGFRNVIQYIV